MEKQRLEELKKYVTYLTVNNATEWELQMDLFTIIEQATAQADKENLTTDLSGNTGQLEGKSRTEMRRKLTERKYRIEQLERFNLAITAELLYLRDKLAQFDSTDSTNDSTRATPDNTRVTQPTTAEVQRAIAALNDTRIYLQGRNMNISYCNIAYAIDLAITALRQMQEPEQTAENQSEQQPDDTYELAVYKRLGITSQRAYELIQMENNLKNTGGLFNDLAR